MVWMLPPGGGPQIAQSSSSGPGPFASGTGVNVDFTNPNGQTVSRYIWGVATDDFATISGDATVRGIFSGLGFPLWRFNSAGGFTEDAFPAGATTSSNMATVFGPLINNWSLWMPPDARIILGIGYEPDNWSSAANYATVCSTIASYFNTTNGSVTGAPCPIYGFEIGNEPDGGSGTAPAYYTSYFNAAKTAIKAINSNYKVMGPVFSFINNVSTFVTACSPDVLDYHVYQYSGQTEFDTSTGSGGVGGVAGFLKDTSSGFAYAFAGISDADSGAIPIFIGEHNGNNTFGTNSGGDSPGVCNTYMCNYAGAVNIANCLWSGHNETNNFEMAGIWSAFQDSDYGVVGATDVAGGGNNVSPTGYLLSRGAGTVYGARATDTRGASNPALNVLATSGGPGGTKFGVMLINDSTGTSITCQVALSHWPANGSGNGTIDVWTVSAANPSGALTSASVSAGLISSLTVPAASVVILSN